MKKIEIVLFCLFVLFGLGFSSKVVKMQANINTKYSDFAPVVSPDGQVLYFTSDRPQGMGGQDVWVSHFLDGEWTEPINVGSPLNTPSNEGPDTFTYDDERVYMYITLCNRPDGLGMCDIYISVYDPDGYWTEPKNLGPPINTEFNEVNAYFDPSEQVLYFSSTRPGGLGRRGRPNEASFDLWYSKRNPDGSWSAPKNLGKPINTEETEIMGFFDAPTGWLFFSSNGHSSIGGADIFKVKRLGKDRWGKVIPVKAVNSKGNDQYFYIPANSKYAYFNSDVEGDDNIYMIPLTEILTEEELELRALAYASNPPPAVPALGDLADVFRKKFCPVVAIQQPKIANTVYFEFDKAELNEDAIRVLEPWAQWLKTNPDKKIEVGGHTDNLGDELYNLILSKNRADAVKNWLVEHGVKPEQIMVAYFGETRPAFPNDPKKGNPKNRRAEIKVIK